MIRADRQQAIIQRQQASRSGLHAMLHGSAWCTGHACHVNSSLWRPAPGAAIVHLFKRDLEPVHDIIAAPFSCLPSSATASKNVKQIGHATAPTATGAAHALLDCILTKLQGRCSHKSDMEPAAAGMPAGRSSRADMRSEHAQQVCLLQEVADTSHASCCAHCEVQQRLFRDRSCMKLCSSPHHRFSSSQGPLVCRMPCSPPEICLGLHLVTRHMLVGQEQ